MVGEYLLRGFPDFVYFLLLIVLLIDRLGWVWKGFVNIFEEDFLSEFVVERCGFVEFEVLDELYGLLAGLILLFDEGEGSWVIGVAVVGVD